VKIDELEAALRDVAMREPAATGDVYPSVLHTARRRRTRRRTAAGAGALLCVLAVAFVGFAVTKKDSRPAAVSIPQSAATEFHPPSHLEGDRLVIPVAFLTGGHAEIVMPSGSIDRDALTFVPGGAITWTGSPELGRSLEISRGTLDDEFVGQHPTAVYQDALGNPVPFYTGASDNNVNHLAFQIGPWIVKVWDYPEGDPRGPAMTDDERRTWAAHFRGHVTQQGFLVLDPNAPLTNAPTDSPDAELIDGNNRMGIIFRGCSQSELQGYRNDHGYIVTSGAPGPVLCNPDLAISVWMGGDQTFEQAANSLEIRNLDGPLPNSAN
jgi:hypothetical protein